VWQGGLRRRVVSPRLDRIRRAISSGCACKTPMLGNPAFRAVLAERFFFERGNRQESPGFVQAFGEAARLSFSSSEVAAWQRKTRLFPA
jgi:hypothetical protein